MIRLTHYPMTADQVKIVDLLRRANVSKKTISSAVNSDSLRTAVNVAADMLGENSPDENWFREYYELTGEHMHLTEEGWIPAEMNTLAYTGSEPMEVLEEVKP